MHDQAATALLRRVFSLLITLLRTELSSPACFARLLFLSSSFLLSAGLAEVFALLVGIIIAAVARFGGVAGADRGRSVSATSKKPRRLAIALVRDALPLLMLDDCVLELAALASLSLDTDDAMEDRREDRRFSTRLRTCSRRLSFMPLLEITVRRELLSWTMFEMMMLVSNSSPLL